jgi:hypothetical protein
MEPMRVILYIAFRSCILLPLTVIAIQSIFLLDDHRIFLVRVVGIIWCLCESIGLMA